MVGIDVGSESHYARAFDWRGYEYSKKAFQFSNTKAGFGMEPTGLYWFNLGKYLKDNEINPVLVNPHHVKKSRELDDNSQTKTDHKDPKTIAKPICEGRYSHPYLPEGIYADLRTASNLRFQLTSELTRIQNHIQRWFSIYFPEYKDVYGSFDGKGSMMILKQAALPEDIVALGEEKVNQIWRDAKLRAVGMKRAKILIEASGLEY